MQDFKVKALLELLREISENEVLINDACFYAYAYSKKFAGSRNFDEILRLKAKEMLYISLSQIDRAISTKKALAELLKETKVINFKKKLEMRRI